MLLLTPNDVLNRGFRHYNGLPTYYKGGYTKHAVNLFKKFYGSSPAVVANMWFDMQDKTDAVPEKMKSEAGFKRLLIATHFLWAYPKNAEILAKAFGVCVRYVQGEELWIWVKRIGELENIKFVWPTDIYKNPDAQIIIISVDGVDFRVWEKAHPTLPIDRGQYSHKYEHAALKYEIAIDVHESKVVRISGPYRGGESDKGMFVKGGLSSMIPKGKKW